MRLLNVTLDENKNIMRELTKIYGIGLSRSKKILNVLEIDSSLTINELTDAQKEKLKEFLLYNEKTIGNALRRSIINNVKKEIILKTYKGIRYKHRLPVRGQRTRTNAKTARKQMLLLEIF